MFYYNSMSCDELLVLFQAETDNMSFIFDWIYRGFSSVLQFLGE